MYDQTGQLQSVAVALQGAVDGNGNPVWTDYVTNITYNAKAQRLTVATGNNVTTTYAYDPATFRLTGLVTRRAQEAFPGDCPNPPARPCGVQNLRYTYDPTGNVTAVADGAQQRIFYDNTVVDPGNDYTYDALYRLVAATGREHIGQADTPQTTWNDIGRTNLPLPTDGAAMRRYTELYDYDAVGNMLRLTHQATNGSWTRTFQYREPSAVDPAQTNNRLSTSTAAGPAIRTTSETVTYDAHGNMTSMAHLASMGWDDHDRLRQADRGGGGIVYFVYDSAGMRVRKVLDRQSGTRQLERLYLGHLEIYHEFGGNGDTLDLERQTLRTDGNEQCIAITESRTIGTDPSPTQLVRYQFPRHTGRHLPGARQLRAPDQLRGVLSVRINRLPGIRRGGRRQEAESLQRQRTRRGNRVLPLQATRLRAVAGPVDLGGSCRSRRRRQRLRLRARQPDLES